MYAGAWAAYYYHTNIGCTFYKQRKEVKFGILDQPTNQIYLLNRRVCLRIKWDKIRGTWAILGEGSNANSVLIAVGYWQEENVKMLTNFGKNSNAENVLIAVGFYIGEEKKYDGALPFVIVAAVAALAMIFSEVIFVFVFVFVFVNFLVMSCLK